jgi:hypothetical protein
MAHVSRVAASGSLLLSHCLTLTVSWCPSVCPCPAGCRDETARTGRVGRQSVMTPGELLTVVTQLP